MARPLSARSQAVLWLMDAQVYVEEAMQALAARDTERVLRAMRLARESQRQAAGNLEGVNSERNGSLPQRQHEDRA